MKNPLRNALLAAGFACVVAPGGSQAFGQSASCDRPCLTGVLTTYLNAMVAHKPEAVPAAANFRFTEDMNELKLGEGVWQSAISLGTYRMDFIDVRQGVAAVHAVLEESGMPVLLAARPPDRSAGSI